MAAAGKLRDRITIQRATAEDDGYGNVTAGPWADLMTVWADVMERPGGEKIASGALESSRMATIRVRRTSAVMGVRDADRVQARGVDWNIRSIAAVARNNDLIEFLCEAGVAT